jgi:hypothetical protein
MLVFLVLHFKELGFLSFLLLCFLLSAKGQNKKDANHAQDKNGASLQDHSHGGCFRWLIGLLFLVICGFFFLNGSTSSSSTTVILIFLLVCWHVIGHVG